MLTAVPDYVPDSPWIQVLGQVVVHDGDGATNRLTGSGQRLLAVLVAAGPGGATSERIAEEIWGETQPDPWRPALRMAIARLRKQLPDGWDVMSSGGYYRITHEVGCVDAWRLEEIAASSTVDADDVPWLLAGRPFGDLDMLELVTATTQNLQMLQLAVAERFCDQRPTEVSLAACTALTGMLREHPYNDQLALDVARTLVASGWRDEALLALSAFADQYERGIGAIPPDIEAFVRSGGTQIESDAADASRHEIAKELLPLIERPMLGRTAELATIAAAKGVLVAGPPGAGKSRLLAEAVVNDTDSDMIYIVGDDHLDLPLGPFAVAMPALRDRLLGFVGEDSGLGDVAPERSIATRAWRAVLAHLEQQASARRQLLVVDDAHLLDAASLALVRLLIRSTTSSAIKLVLAGRNDVDDPEWADLMRDAGRAGLETVELGGLDLGELQTMILQQFPDATHQARVGLADEVFEASGGLPAVAVPLIEATDPITLAMPEDLSGAPAITRVASTLSDQAPEVVAAAAILGSEFSIGALIRLADLPEQTVFGVLDELWATRLIVETNDPDRVRFRHVLVQRAFLDNVPLFRRGQLHRRAAELTDDPHRQAFHQVGAGALVSTEETATSLQASAELYASRRQWRKVARELQRLDDLPGDFVDYRLETLWAAALDRSGSDGSAHRRLAYAAAADNEDWMGALDAALSGLPEAERPDGDLERVEMLEGIPVGQLATTERFNRALNLSRQYSLLGEADKVLEHTRQALAYARNPAQQGESHIMRWMATRHIDPEPHPIPTEFDEAASPGLLMRLVQINALNLAEQGDFETSLNEVERFDALAHQLGDPLRIWQAQSMRSMFLLNDGEFSAGDELARSNLEFANVHKLQSGVAAFLGQQVFIYDCQGLLSELGPVISPYRSDLNRLAAGRAALALHESAIGGDVGDEVRELLAEVHAGHVTTLSLITTVLMTRFVVQEAPGLIDQTVALLEPFGDNPLLTSVGGASFGPTTRYVAQLMTDPAKKDDLIVRSIAAADRQGALLWQVLNRLDRAETGDEKSLREALELAAGTELQPVAERRAATFT